MVGPAAGMSSGRCLTRRRPSVRLAWWVGTAAALALRAQVANADVITVGTGAGCTTSSLGVALLLAAANGPGSDEIRLTANQVGNFSINNQSVSIVGGWASCTATAPSGISLLMAPAGGGRVLVLFGATTAQRTVALAHLDLTSGSADFGGGIRVQDKFYLSLEDTWVYSNSATSGGGGIYVDGAASAVVVLDAGSAVNTNSAPVGAGIFCFESTPASAAIGLLDALVNGNTASSFGGGVAVRGCDLTSYSGGSGRGILGNSAATYGGGVYADHGSHVLFAGDSAHAALLQSNSAQLGGAAIMGWEAGTTVALENAWVRNHSGSAAFRMNDGATLSISRTLGQDCHDRVRCSWIAGNLNGVATVNGQLTLTGTVVESNEDDFILIFVDGSALHLIDNALFARNHLRLGGTLLKIAGHSWRIAHTTFVDNLTASDYLIWPDCGVCAAGRRVDFFSDLIAEGLGALLPPAFDPNDFEGAVDCAILRETASIPPSEPVTRILLAADPTLHFVNRPAFDYHLRAGSPAIDFCTAPGGGWPLPLDLDWQSRGFDEPAAVNRWGPFDLGTDETMPGLFSDGFETGATTRWSARR